MKLLPLLTLLSACSGSAEEAKEKREAKILEDNAEYDCRSKLAAQIRSVDFYVSYSEVIDLCANAQTRTFNLLDSDGDGYSNGVDCDNELPDVNPGAVEKCDSVDNNCNDKVDENPKDLSLFEDKDGDNFGNPAKPASICNYKGEATHLVENNDDCDDIRADVHPNASESFQNGSGLDGLDNDCNGAVDLYDGKKAPKNLRGITRLVGYGDIAPQDARCNWEPEENYYHETRFSIFNESNGYDSTEYKPGQNEALLKRCGESINAPWEEIILDVQKGGEGAAKDRSIVSFTAQLTQYFGKENPLWSKQAAHVLTPTRMEFIYDWTFPELLKTWDADLNNDEKRKMLSDLQYAKTYVRTEFNYQEELDYYQALERMSCGTKEDPYDCTHYFTRYGPHDPWRFAIAQRKRCEAMPDGDETFEARKDCWERIPDSRSHDRYTETAVFRRVNNGELTPGTMSYWFGRVQRDLKKGFTYTPEEPVEAGSKAK